MTRIEAMIVLSNDTGVSVVVLDFWSDDVLLAICFALNIYYVTDSDSAFYSVSDS